MNLSASNVVFPSRLIVSTLAELCYRSLSHKVIARLNGKWAVPDTCDQFIDCTSGVERLVTCQNHLVFDDQTGDCEHPDTANRAGCTAEELYGFSCPNTVGQARYAADTDCRAFFTCGVFTNYHPRLGGCPVNSVFNPATQACDQPENVPGCENYYGPAS